MTITTDELVERAFREGHEAGRSSGTVLDEDQDWERSASSAAIAAMPQSSRAEKLEAAFPRLCADGALEIQAGFSNTLHRVALRAGFLLCREYMARFVEQGGDQNTATSIRANWVPALGDDPGPPRQLNFEECVTADGMEAGPWESKDPGIGPESALYAYCAMSELGMELPALSQSKEAQDG